MPTNTGGNNEAANGEAEGGIRIVVEMLRCLDGQSGVPDSVWDHTAEFNAAPVTNWTVAGTPAGEKRSANGFTFLRVYDAGHMVPRDQPANALAMLNAFLDDSL